MRRILWVLALAAFPAAAQEAPSFDGTWRLEDGMILSVSSASKAMRFEGKDGTFEFSLKACAADHPDEPEAFSWDVSTETIDPSRVRTSPKDGPEAVEAGPKARAFARARKGRALAALSAGCHEDSAVLRIDGGGGLVSFGGEGVETWRRAWRIDMEKKDRGPIYAGPPASP